MIARTGYLVSCVSYFVFLTFDWMRPGFVSNFLSPHVFLFAAIIFGFLWARSPKAAPFVHALSLSLFLVPLSFLLATFAWVEGRSFGDLRILVTLVAFAVPFLVARNLDNR